MSVEFHSVYKTVGRGKNARILFDNLNFGIDAGARVAILGAPRSGKSTLLRMICGTDYCTSGTIDRTSSVSWPLPMNDFMTAYSTVSTNIKFLMRLYGNEDDDKVREIAALVEISEFLNTRLSDCPKIVKPRLALALVVGLGFDICLFDERVVTVDKDFRPQAVEIIKSLGPHRSIVVATSQTKEVADLCNMAFVLEDRTLTPFPDVEEAIEHFKALLVKDEDKEPVGSDDEGEQVEEDFVLEIGI